MRYKIMSPAMESLQVGGNPVVTAVTLPTGDPILSPSTSIPIEQSDLEEFCAKTDELVGQIQAAEETAIVLEGIAARLDESSNKAEARATRYVVECLCENVGIEKTELKGNEEGSDPETADKISIVLENIGDSLKKIWQAIREGIKRFIQWVKRFLSGVLMRVKGRPKEIEDFNKDFDEYKKNLAGGMNVTLNQVPYKPTPDEFKLLTGGTLAQGASIDTYYKAVCDDVVGMVATLSNLKMALYSMVDAIGNGSDSRTVFCHLSDIRTISSTETKVLKNGVGNIKPGAITTLHQGKDIGTAFSVYYRLFSFDIPLRDEQDMIEAIGETAIILEPRQVANNVTVLPVLDANGIDVMLELILKYEAITEMLGGVLDTSDDVCSSLLAAVDSREKRGLSDPEQARLFSAMLDIVQRLLITPGAILHKFAVATAWCPCNYLKHHLQA